MDTQPNKPGSDKAQVGEKPHAGNSNLSASRVARSGLWVSAGSVTTMLSTLLVCASIAKTHSPEQTGLFFLLLSMANLFRSFATLGVPMASVRFLAEALAQGRHSRIRSILARAGLFAAIGVAGSFLVLVLNREFIGTIVFRNQGFAQLAVLTGLWGMLAAAQTTVAEFQRGMGRIPSATLTTTLPSAAVAVLLVLSVVTQSSLSFEVVILAFIAALAITTLVSYSFLARHTGCFPKRFGEFHFRELGRVSLPIWVGSVTAFLFSRVNLWMLSHYHGANEVAVFGATLQLAILSGFPLMIAIGTVAPNVSALYARKHNHDMELLLRTSAQIQFAAAVAIAVGVLFVGRVALRLVYSDFYAAGILPLVMLAVAYCFNAWTGLPGLLLNMSGHQTVAMACGVIAVSLGIATSFLFVPRVGVAGAAMGSSVSIVSHNLLTMVFCKRRLGIRTWATASLVPVRRVRRALAYRARNSRLYGCLQKGRRLAETLVFRLGD